MSHEILYLREIFIFLAAAGLIIPIAVRLGISPILGFLFIGLLIGPYGVARFSADIPLLEYVVITDLEGVRRIAELGIVFLLFTIGLELSVKQLWQMRRLVFGLGASQVVITALAIGSIAYGVGVPMIAASIIGLCLALSSTALVLHIMTETGRLSTPSGRVSLGVLLFQDLAVVPILFFVNLAGAEARGDLAGPAIWTVLQATLVIAAIVFMGGQMVRPLLQFVGGVGSREVFMAAILLIILATAALTAQVGLSMGLGALLAGLLFAGTEYRHQVASDIEPFKGLLLGLFFISVGMSLDVAAVWKLLGWVVLSVVGLLTLKSVLLFLLARFFRLPTPVAVESAVLLGQGGEFAFVVIAAGLAVGLLGPSVSQFMLLVVILTMFLTPFLSIAARNLALSFQGRATARVSLADPEIAGGPHVIIGGFGRVGRVLAELLDEQRVPYVTLDTDPDLVANQRSKGVPVFFGDASQPDVLIRLGIDRAAAFVTTMDSPESAEHVVSTVHRRWPHVPIYARARDSNEARRLRNLGAFGTVPETVESSLELCEQLLTGIGFPEDAARQIVEERRNLFAARIV